MQDKIFELEKINLGMDYFMGKIKRHREIHKGRANQHKIDIWFMCLERLKQRFNNQLEQMRYENL